MYFLMNMYICIYVYVYIYMLCTCVCMCQSYLLSTCVLKQLSCFATHIQCPNPQLSCPRVTQQFSSHPAALQICIRKSTRVKMAPVTQMLPYSYVVAIDDMHYCLAFGGHTHASNWSGLDPQEIAAYRHHPSQEALTWAISSWVLSFVTSVQPAKHLAK